MAFYQNAPKKKTGKRNYANEGSWADEGTHYNRTPRGDRNDNRPRGGFGSQSDRSQRGFAPQGNRNDNRPRGGFGSQSDRSQRGFAPQGNRNDNRPKSGFGSQSDRSQRGFAPRGDRNDDRLRAGFGNQSDRSQRGFAPRGDRAPQRDFTQRPARNDAPATPRFGRAPSAPVPAPKSYRDFQYREPAQAAPAAVNPVIGVDEGTQPFILAGRNPIRETLKAGRDLEKLYVQRGELSGSAREIVQLVKDRHIPVQEAEKARLDELAPHHQGLVAIASAYQYASVEDMLSLAAERREAPFLVLLDGVTDPHNLGAIIRTAECAGVHGVILPERWSVGLTPAAVKASAGAIEHVKVARVTNINRTIEALQKENVWAYALTMDGRDYEKVDFDGGVALVIGAEGEGISRLTREVCDTSVSIPLMGQLESLNASVAAGIMMYRILSTRRKP